MASDKDGGLWVGLENSSFGFCDGQTFSFRGREAWAGVDNEVEYVHSILESKDGTIWLETDGAVLRLMRSGTYEEVLGALAKSGPQRESVNVLCGYEDTQGRLWFGTVDKGVYCWQAGKVSKLPDPNLDGKSIVCIAEDKEEKLWIGTEMGLFCYDAHLMRKNIPPMGVEIRALLADRHGVLWIGTTGQGLACYRNGNYSYLRKTDGLASDYVRALAEDREGSLWIGTRGGLSQLTDVKFKTQPAAEDPTVQDALAVCPSRKGGIWVGSGAGLTYFDGAAKTYGFDAGFPNTYIKRVFEASDGDVYARQRPQDPGSFLRQQGRGHLSRLEHGGRVGGRSRMAWWSQWAGRFTARAGTISRLTFLPMATRAWTGCSIWPKGGTGKFGSLASTEFFASRTAAIASGGWPTAWPSTVFKRSRSMTRVWSGLRH